VTRDTPTLSVVIPTHNTRDLTLAAVAAVQGAEPEAEIIVVDDASSDGTVEVLARHSPGATCLRSASRQGFSVTANTGLAQARGEVVVLLNSDTQVRPGALAALSQAFSRAPELGVAGARLVYPDGQPQWSGGRFPTQLWLAVLVSGIAARRRRPRRAVSTGAAPVDWVTGAAMAIRREVLETVGPLDEGYAFYAQDLDYCRRASEAGWTVDLVADAEVVHHHGATIGTDRGAADGVRLDLLWCDLLRYVATHDGPGAGRRARFLMRSVLAARRVARAVVAPWIAPDHRSDHRALGEALARAAEALGSAEIENQSKEAW
jgi:GT2 family glycosyltransferase